MLRKGAQGLALLIFLLVPAWTVAQAQTRILCFGDSITFGLDTSADHAAAGGPDDGFLPHLALWLNQYWGPVELLNAGVLGDTTDGGRDRIQSVLQQTAPDMVLVMLGTNDVTQIWSSGTGLSQAIDNLGVIVSRVAEFGAEPVLATIPPRYGASSDGNNQVTFAYNQEVRSLANAFGISLVDQENNFNQHWIKAIYSDPFHPSEAGYQLMAEEFAATISGQSRGGIDLVAPFPIDVVPKPWDRAAPPNTGINISLGEFGAGIDLSSFSMAVNNASISPILNGDDTSLPIAYTPPVPWAFGQQVSVQLWLSDSSALVNTLHLDYGFTVSPGNGTGGDLDSSGRVDGADLIILAVAFGSSRGQGRYTPTADVDLDGVVDGNDLAFVASQFGSVL